MLHSRDYRRPAQLPDGAVLVVGAGNSGAEIAADLASDGRDVRLSGRDVGYMPRLGAGPTRSCGRSDGPARRAGETPTGGRR